MLSQEKIKDLPGSRDVLEDLSEIRRKFVASLTPEERLDGLTPEERLHGLTPADLLRSMGPEELARLRALLANGATK